MIKTIAFITLIFLCFASCSTQNNKAKAQNISWFKETYNIPDSLIKNLKSYCITTESDKTSSILLFVYSFDRNIIVFEPKTNQIRLNTSVDSLKGDVRIVAKDLENFVIEGKYGFNVYFKDKVIRYISKSILPEDTYIQILPPFDYHLKSKSFLVQLLDFRDKEGRSHTMDYNVLAILDSTMSLRSIDYRVSKAYGNGELVDTYLYYSTHSDDWFSASLSHSDSTVSVSSNSDQKPVYTYWGKHFTVEDFVKPTDTTPMGLFRNRQENIKSYSYGKSMFLRPTNSIPLQIRFLYLPKTVAPKSNEKYTTHPVRVLVQDSLGNRLPHFDIPGNVHFNLEKWFSDGKGICHLNMHTPINSETRTVYLEVFTPVVY